MKDAHDVWCLMLARAQQRLDPKSIVGYGACLACLHVEWGLGLVLFFGCACAQVDPFRLFSSLPGEICLWFVVLEELRLSVAADRSVGRVVVD